jgi:AAA+ superfamily predicted ATPase
MDAMTANVFLVAATNHHHLLDPAIWRRFNTSILLDFPESEQRDSIIRRFMQETLPSYTLDIKTITVLTEGTSGAQICNFLQALARFVVLQNKEEITREDILGVWIKQSTLFPSENKDSFESMLYELHKSGVPLRTLEEISGIPKSTLDYTFKKEEKNEQRTVNASVDSR